MGVVPGIATFLGLAEEGFEGFGVVVFEGVDEGCEVLGPTGEGCQESVPIGEGDIAPHFWRTGGDAGGVAESGGAEDPLGAGMAGIEDMPGEQGGDDVREVAGATDDGIVFESVHDERDSADGFPEFEDGFESGLGGVEGGGNDATCVDEEIGAGGGDAGLFGAGHGMGADEPGIGLEAEGFEGMDDGSLGGADVGDDGVWAEVREDGFGEGGELADGSAEDDQVGIADGGGEVG